MSDIVEQEIPKECMEKIQQLSKKFDIPVEKLIEMYWEIYNDQSIPEAEFKTDFQRHKHTILRLWVRIAAQPPTIEIICIPFGFTGIRISKASGMKMSRIYMLVKERDTWEKRVLVCRGLQAELINDVILFQAYNLKVSKGGGIYFATASTRFDNPRPLNISPIKLLTRMVGVEKIKIAETPYKLSKRQGRYIDEWDLKMIEGLVLRYNRGRRPDDTEWAVYTISDDSVGITDVTEDGKIIPSQFTVWVAPQQMKWAEDSEIIAVGTVQLNDKEPFMNAITIIPIVAKPIPEI